MAKVDIAVYAVMKSMANAMELYRTNTFAAFTVQ